MKLNASVVNSTCWFVALAASAGLLFSTGCKKEKAAPAASAPTLAPPALIAAPAPVAVRSANPSDVVVQVNDAKMTQGEVDSRIDRFLAGQGDRMAGLPPESMVQVRNDLQEKIIEGFVVRTVLMDEANRQKIEIGTNAVSEAVEQETAKLPDGVTLESALKSIGATEASFRKEIEQDLRIEKLLDIQSAQIPNATEAEAKEFYDELKESGRIVEEKFEDLKDELAMAVADGKRQQAIGKYIADLKSKVKVTYGTGK